MSESDPLGKPNPGAGRRPEWLRVHVRDSVTFKEVDHLMRGLKLHTVCEEARCPNIWECWGQHRTATFLIMGDICTRNCRYCTVQKGRPGPLDVDEPRHVADAVMHLGLRHAVITSVDRDDLEDFGSGHYARTIHAVRERTAGIRIEVLIPDFQGDEASLRRVLDAGPDVLNHNTETVPRLFPRLRARGDFSRSLALLARADAYRRDRGLSMVTKSGLIVGLGETTDEIHEVMDELRRVNCDVMTIGQYLNPTRKHTPVVKFYTPDEFAELKRIAMKKGFAHVESAPLVRSSYHAAGHVPPSSSC